MPPIPFHDFGGHGPDLHFHHANGYPPQAYRPLFERLCPDYHVWAIRMRALWPGASTQGIRDWRVFADDLDRFLDEHGLDHLVGIGHSIGGTTTLRLALRKPNRFRKLVLIDPVLFPIRTMVIWKLIFKLGLAYRLHPLVQGAQKRRRTFESRQAMFDNYRKKAVFRRMDDQAVAAYVDSLACERPDGTMELCYPPEWEALIYVTSMQADFEIWRDLPGLKPEVLLIRGAETDTFWETTARKFQRRLPNAQVISLPDTTHLLPLEAPDRVAAILKEFLEK